MTTSPGKLQAASALTVDIIDDQAAFRDLKAEWQALEMRDPEATVFLSWDWLDQAFRGRPYRWSVLVARPRGGGDAVALLPLKYSTRWSGSTGAFQTHLEAGGRLLHSDLAGFLCDPAQEKAAIAAIAARLMRMPWAGLSLRHMAQLRRAEQFGDLFRRAGYSVAEPPEHDSDGRIDRLLCPRISLPESFDAWLQDSISAEVASRYRALKARHFAGGEYRFTHSDEATFDTHLEIMRRMRNSSVADGQDVLARKSAQVAEAAFDRLLTAALRADALFLPILWRGDVPLGALGHILDPRMGIMHFVTAAQDASMSEPFIATALHFHAIECAILLGCDAYDFGRGDEPYKLSYGAQHIQLISLKIRREQVDDASSGNGRFPGLFDSICTGAALRQIDEFLENGKNERARRACRQLARLFT